MWRWLYLEPILYNDDGDLGVKFRKVDLLFKQVARIIEADPRVSALVHSTRLKPMLDAITDQLNACQSALNQYMEEKRSVFPRLYFLSDDDLLELLGQARAGAQGREVVMQTHLKKLFPGITGVRLGPGGVSLTTLCSQYGEMFTLDQPVDIDCSVEVWLNRLEQEIRSSLKSLTLKCLAKHGSPHQDPFSLPTQILCLLQNIRFTEQAESAILTKDLRKLKDNIEKEHIYYAEAEVDNENEKCKRQALILQCSYYASVIDSLIEQNVVATSDWLWQKQLRFYLVNKEEVVAKMGLAQISYSYEYLGVVTGQFVRTESTDDSFLILTQALHLGFVGNPFGPAGTGKTESVKALGSLVGRLVLVFNCDEAMDACCLARLLSGVARCGAWGCFDEFNRLERPALAAAAHQLTALLAALTARDEHVVLQGKKVPLSQWCGVAVTLNPAGRGYGGRRELPAALQAALRPLALRPPPSSLLASRLLAAHAPCRDTDHYHRLGEDLDCVFQLASTLLSSQRHYDWGLRALKAAVSSCGAALAAGGAEGQLTRRRAVLRRVLRLNNLSKLTPDDAERFENILSMVFAEVPEEQVATDPVRSALEEAVHRLGLVTNDIQIQKCVELYEQLQQRMGVVIVGPPGSGKTTIRRLLKTALVSRGRSIVEYVIRPKALERGWLLGAAAGSSATTGVLHTVALQATAQDDETWSWVVCDGDIDPDWVEGLNSVLDDNRLLCLPTGERVCLRRGVSFLFETDALSAASPATLTRLAPILLSEDNDCSREVLERWSRRTELENETMKQTLTMMRDVTEKVHAWMKRNSTELFMKHCGVSTVTQIISQFEQLVVETSSDVRVLGVEELVHIAVLRGATSIIKQRAIEDFYREASDMQLSPAPPPASHSLHSLQGPRLRSASLILQASLLHSHALLLGPVASGKNVLAEYVMRETFSTVVVIDCTPVLEPSDIIEELKRRNLVGGSSSRGGAGAGRAAGGAGVLVRSLHRAARDSWGSVRVHDFLLQLIQEGGFWSMEGGAPQWLSVCRFTLLVTSAAVSRLSPRLSAALQPLFITEPDDDELLELSEMYLRDSIPTDTPDGDVSDLVRRMLTLYKEVVATFDSQPHYSWNCSHIRRWCENVKLYCPTNTTDVWTAITAEAHMIFRERLITADERSQYETIVQKHLPGTHPRMFYRPKMRNDAIYLERLEEEEWYRHTQKTINQCLTDDEQAFVDVAVEACEELTLWIIAAATAVSIEGKREGRYRVEVLMTNSRCPQLSGCVSTCVSSEGAGRRAGARLAAAALGAATHTLTHERHLHTLIHDALSSSVSGRSLLVVCGSACSRLVLGSLEALLSADSFQSLPSAMVPSTGNNTPSLANIKQNLGIMICLDKDQEKLKELMEEFPLLHESSRLCWLQGWSEDTLRKMPSLVIHRLMKEDAQGESQEELNTVPVEGFVAIYTTVEEGWLRAPARYIHFIKAYYHILSHKRTALMQRKNMLAVGVKALSVARGTVATLQGQAEEQERALGLERAAAADALQQMGATVRAATSRKEDMQRLKDDIQAENEKLQLRKKEIEAELASVEPVVAAARAAVGDIRPEALSEVRSLRAPPEVVRDVLEGVLRLMGIADTSWHSMKNFLSKRGVKEDIRHLDAADISPEAAAAVSRLVERRAASFTAESARRASAAVAPLAAWVRANLEHVHALSRVRPLQEQQRELHERLRRAEEEVAALSSGLVSVEGRVSELQEQLGQHAHEAAALEHKLQLATHTLRAATTLLDQLGHEARTWDDDLQNISIEILELNQRSLLAAGYLLYLPHLTEQQARENLLRWSSLIQYEDANFSVINFLSSSEEQLCWQAEGLPTDLSAAKNALTLHQFLSGVGLRPLLVDPEGEARTWLKLASTVSMETVSGGGRELGVVMQQAQRTGGTLLVTEADQLEGWWWSAPGAARAVLLTGDTAMLERLEPHIRATLAPLLFTSRLDALLDQLVNYAIEKRHPEMFEKWKEMKLKTATLQKQQHEAQEHLLKELSVSRDILQDEGLVAALDGARAATGQVTAARAEQEALAKAVAESAEACRPPALTAARLALAVRRLASRRPLLALPATALRDAFLESLDKDQEQVTKHFVKKTLKRVMLSVHRRERWVVMLHLMKHVHQDLVNEKLWQLLVNNFNMEVRDENSTVELQNKYHWMSKNSARRVALIKTLDEDLFERLSLGQWTSEGDLFVLEGASLSPGERVLVAAALNPGALHQAVMQCVEQLMEGTSFTDGEAVPRALRCSAPGQPVLLLAPHAGQHLATVATSRGQTLTTVGIDDGLVAWEDGLQRARPGGWLAVTVGASPFTRDLTVFVASIAERANEFSDEFRLWILAEERPIPYALTSACVTVILEPAEGVKRAACSALESWSGQSVTGETARLAAGLALLHALVTERRAYIPIDLIANTSRLRFWSGWSRWYGWGWCEWRACQTALQTAGQAARPLCFSLYSSRVSERADRRVLLALEARCLSGTPALRLPSSATLQSSLHTSIPDVSLRPQDYACSLESLPSSDSASLLQLPLNCRSARLQLHATHIMDGLREFNSTSRVKEEGSFTSSKILQSLWKKLMSGSPLLKPDYRVKDCVGWWGAVVSAEARDAARGARLLHASLSAARFMSPMTQVPESWQLVWAGPDLPHDYLREFTSRVKAAHLRTLEEAPTRQDYMPTELDLRLFLRPDRVLSALLALIASRLACPPATLVLTAQWNCTDVTAETGGLSVKGLSLSGGVWSSSDESGRERKGEGFVAAVSAESPALSDAPPILLRYVRRAEDSSQGSRDPQPTLIPLYESPRRETELCWIRAPLGASLTAQDAALHALALVVTPHD
ncbi:unnamed protein product [Danaus chrysippus]|uniref:Dynein heavy chain, cytoplasmic n=1 Tax=Danaus chrysippus TaxID=151541 RepID=A0A8J2VRI1_9NEOP|nr:unnamed protein product [Danaus chrysippus]